MNAIPLNANVVSLHGHYAHSTIKVILLD